MFAFAKQFVKSTAEGIINNAGGAYDSPAGAGYAAHAGAAGAGTSHDRDPTHGFRVVHVASGSPANAAGIDPLFDFVVGINGHAIVGFAPQYAATDYAQPQSPVSPYNPYPGQDATGYHADPNSYQPQQYAPDPANPQGPYQPQHAGSAPATNPKTHGRRASSISFSPASFIIPQLIPPQSELAPIDPFVAEIANCRGRSISLDIWSSKGRVYRTVVLPVPSTPPATPAPELADGGTAPQDTQTLGIGLSLQWTPLSVADHVWHVLNVAPNSPAEAAGLISHSDYIVGAEGGLLEHGGEDLLGRVVTRLVASHANVRKQQLNQLNQITEEAEVEDGAGPLSEAERNAAVLVREPAAAAAPAIVDSRPELELYVYNHDYNTLRPVRIRPNTTWGGSGLLGCGVGYGLLHRLPAVTSLGLSAGAGQYQLQQQQQQLHQLQQQQQQQYTQGPPPTLPPGGTLFDSGTHHVATPEDFAGGDYFVPAGTAAPHIVASPPPPSAQTGAAPPPLSALARKKKHHHMYLQQHPLTGAPATDGTAAPPPSQVENDLAAYFAEEEERSREVEGPGSTRASNIASPPPPPAASGSPPPPPPAN